MLHLLLNVCKVCRAISSPCQGAFKSPGVAESMHIKVFSTMDYVTAYTKQGLA